MARRNDDDGFTEDSDEEQEEDIIDFMKFEPLPASLPESSPRSRKMPASLISERVLPSFTTVVARLPTEDDRYLS
jgi:hypothetical protein